MTNNSIGQFIAALRKANGLTQQDVANRLNISNKSVSRWERGECYPDLSLIPALAEMFDVTCDELLKGERINKNQQTEKSYIKIEKQIKTLVNRSISGFKNLTWISIALSAIGLICMFGISYGFYRPVIGFFVMLLFELSSFIIVVISINKIRDVKTDNELLENADSELTKKFNSSLGTYSYNAFFTIISVILLSLPLVIFNSDYVESVLELESYLIFFIPIALMLTLIFIKAKIPFYSWVTMQPYKKTGTNYKSKTLSMTLLQLSMVILAGILFIIAPCFNNTEEPYASSLFVDGLMITGFVLLVGNIVCFTVFMIKYKEYRKNMLLSGIRNILMIPSGFLLSRVHNVILYDYYDYPAYYNKIITSEIACSSITDYWNFTYLVLSIVLALLIAVIFSIIENIISKKNK